MAVSTEGKRTSNLAYRFFSNASIYGIGSVLVRFGSFLVLPLYWGVLTPEDFGRIATVQIITQLLLSILDLGLSGSLQRHFFEWKKEERVHHLAAIWSCSLGFSLLICLVLSGLAPSLGSLFEQGLDNSLVYFGIWTAFFQNFGVLPISLFRIREQMKLFSLISIGQFVVQTGATLFCLFILNLGFRGYLWGTFLGSILFGISCLVYIYRQVQFPWKWWHLRDVLRYALPTMPAAVLEGVSSTMDRFFLQKYVPLSELGIYSLARQFGQIYNFFVGMLKNSWVPLTYRIVVERPDDAPKVLSKMGTYYLLVLVVPAALVAVLAQDVIILFNRPEYFQIGPYIPWFVLAVFITGFGHIHGRGLDLAKKTQYNWLMYAGQLIVNVVGLVLLAPRYGAWGAVASVVAANFARELIQITLAYYFYPRPVDLRALLSTLVIQSVSIAICLSLPIENPWVAVPVKIIIVASFSLLNVAVALGSDALNAGLEKVRKKFGRA